jgi:hypothetical protein
MFFVLYHYKTNSILATPITNLDDKSIFEAYKANFEMLEAKRYKPKVNVMDNQATKYIEKKSQGKRLPITTCETTQPSRECS